MAHLYIDAGASGTFMLDDYPPHLIPQAIREHNATLSNLRRGLGYHEGILRWKEELEAQGLSNVEARLRARFPVYMGEKALEDDMASIQWKMRYEIALIAYFEALHEAHQAEAEAVYA